MGICWRLRRQRTDWPNCGISNANQKQDCYGLFELKRKEKKRQKAVESRKKKKKISTPDGLPL